MSQEDGDGALVVATLCWVHWSSFVLQRNPTSSPHETKQHRDVLIKVLKNSSQR